MRFELPQLLAAVHVPEAHRGFEAPRQHAAAVRRQRDAQDLIAVPAEAAHLVAEDLLGKYRRTASYFGVTTACRGLLQSVKRRFTNGSEALAGLLSLGEFLAAELANKSVHQFKRRRGGQGPDGQDGPTDRNGEERTTD